MYLLDANVFIEAKNRYYAFDICPGFWSWMDHMLPQKNVVSIVNVYDELTHGNDELAQWAKKQKALNFFLDVSDTATQTEFIKIVTEVQNGPYTPAAKSNFLAKADPWLIAKAIITKATVVTHELPHAAKKRVLIPNICESFGVQYANTFELLRHFSASFIL